LGCQTETVITIIVEEPCTNFTVPNVFTPNNAGPYGENNVFYIKTEYLSAWSIVIFDRWGKEIYKSSNPQQYWDGKTEGGGEAPSGVYYYIINATCQGTTYKKDGFVQLIR
jgi:gliding motility-associated-like protein